MFISPRALGDASAGPATAELLALARDRGAQRVTLLSAVTVEDGGGHKRFADTFKAVEDAAKASGLPWTILRCTDFAANSLAWAPQILATGVVRGAYGNAATSTVHEHDVAAVSARALLDPAHAGHCYILSGLQSLTQRDKVRIIGETIGKQLTWEEISAEQVRQTMISQGVPEEIPDRLLGYLADRVQQPGPSSTAVEQILGRPPLSFAEWAAEHTAAFCDRNHKDAQG